MEDGARAHDASCSRCSAIRTRACRPFTLRARMAKGASSARSTRCCAGSGLRVGKYTSPHLIDFRERIAVNGVPIREEDVVSSSSDGRPTSSGSARRSSRRRRRWRSTTSCARSVDVAVIEVGLGGRLDSTNVITPVAAGVSSIGIDHVQYLGDTLELIAREKAGIFKRGVPAVIGESDPALRAFLATLAHEAGATPVRIVADEWTVSGISVALDGTRFRLRTDGGTRELRTPLDRTASGDERCDGARDDRVRRSAVRDGGSGSARRARTRAHSRPLSKRGLDHLRRRAQPCGLRSALRDAAGGASNAPAHLPHDGASRQGLAGDDDDARAARRPVRARVAAERADGSRVDACRMRSSSRSSMDGMRPRSRTSIARSRTRARAVGRR